MHPHHARSYPPELQLVICCARRELTPEHKERIGTLIRQGVDWDTVIKLALAHRLLPLVQTHLESAAGVMLPPAVSLSLRRLFLENLGWQLKLTGELHRLLSDFRQCNIPVLPYKGPALAEEVYGSVALRMSSDLDLLVRRRDVERTRELLLARGYRPQQKLTEAGRAFMLRSRYSEGYDGPDGTTVEMHWGFTNMDVSFQLRLEDLEPRLSDGSVGGKAIPVMSREDLLLVLCVHGAKHLWAHVEWISGVAEVLRAPEGLDWGVVLARAREYRVELMVLLGAAVAHELLEAPVPPALLRRIRSDSHVNYLVGEVMDFLKTPEVARESAEAYGSLRHDIFHFRLREHPRDRARFLWYRMTTPSQPQNWIAVPVGRWSIPLHAFLRPLRVLTKITPATFLYLRKVRQRNVATAPQRPELSLVREDVREEVGGAAPMRILQLVQKPQRRGAEVFALQLGEELRRQGHVVRTVYLYSHAGEEGLALEEGDVVLDGNPSSPADLLIGANPVLLRRVRRAIADFAPDIVQLNGGRTLKYGLLARLLSRDQGFVLVYRNIGNPRDWIRGKRRTSFYRWLMSRVDGVVAVSEGALTDLRDAFALRRPAVVIRTGIDEPSLLARRPREEVRAELRTPSDAPVILFVGSLTTEKRVDRLIDALPQLRSELPETRLWIVGAGELRPVLEARAKAAGVAEAVSFVGASSEVGSYLAAADVFALTSDTEGIPAVLLEAGYAGLPSVATQVGGISECVLDGRTGILVPPQDGAALVEALGRLLRDPRERGRMGNEARKWIAENFCLSTISGQYVEFFTEVLAQGSASSTQTNRTTGEVVARAMAVPASHAEAGPR